jgi:hypothetical protein
LDTYFLQHANPSAFAILVFSWLLEGVPMHS